MFKLKAILVAAVCAASVLLISTSSFASVYDYSDAPGYGWAWNRGAGVNQPIQWLGATWNHESAPVAVDSSDDGVWWKTANDTYYGHGSVITGETVWFKVEVHEATWNYWTDYLRVWLDWDANTVFDDDEQIISWDWIEGQGTNNSATLYFSMLVPEDAAIGSTWLRARIACGTAGAYKYAYGNVSQGECEDWEIEIRGTEVPEPTTICLFLSGIAGLFIKRNKKA